jgi:predicted nucleic acid-binding protein
MFLLDTNVISELRKAGSGRADPGVLRWANEHDADTLFVSVVTLMELEIGVLSIERKDSAQGRLLREWFERQVLVEFDQRTLSIDSAVALRCAKLHVPNKRSERDALIAATALVHGMCVVTRNVDDFIGSGVAVANPWG